MGKKRDTLENMSTNTAIVAAPIALANLVTVAFTFVDFGVLGRHLGSDKLAGTVLAHTAVNLVLEPSVFILHNAVTSLSAYGAAAKDGAQLYWHFRAASVFSLLLAVPIGVLALASPSLLREPALAVPEALTRDVAVYAPAYALSVLPTLLLSALQGFLRAHGQQRSTALLCCFALVPNLLLASALVPACGLRGSAYATAATRLTCLLLLGVRHSQLLRPAVFANGILPRRSSSDGNPSAPQPDGTISKAAGAAHPLCAPLLYIANDYSRSLMPVVLRVNMLPLLTLVAVMPAFALLAGSSAATASRGAASFALTGLLLHAGLGVCTGVQQATIMLVTRHVGVGRFAEAHGSMRLAAALLFGLASFCGIPCHLLRSQLGTLFLGGGGVGEGDVGAKGTARSEIMECMQVLGPYVAPLLILRTASGLFGLFFAVTGRRSIGTWILLVAHCCIGLPAAWQWASVTGGGPAALMQTHTGSWLLATLALAVCYATLPTAPPQATAVTLEGPEFSLETSALSSARARGVRLAQPLLDRDGGPA